MGANILVKEYQILKDNLCVLVIFSLPLQPRSPTFAVWTLLQKKKKKNNNNNNLKAHSRFVNDVSSFGEENAQTMTVDM